MDFQEVDQIYRLTEAFTSTDTGYEWRGDDGCYIKIVPKVKSSHDSFQKWAVELGVPVESDQPTLSAHPSQLPGGDQHWERLQTVLSWAPKDIDCPRSDTFLNLERADDSYHNTYRAYYRGSVREKSSREQKRTV